MARCPTIEPTTKHAAPTTKARDSTVTNGLPAATPTKTAAEKLNRVKQAATTREVIPVLRYVRLDFHRTDAKCGAENPSLDLRKL